MEMETAPSQTPDASRPKPKSSGVVVPHQPKWHQRLAAWAVYTCIRAVSMTLRYQWNDDSGYYEKLPAGPAIFCCWHNRLVLCMVGYQYYVTRRNNTPGLAALISASKDGGFLSVVMGLFGATPVRGSSSRRGAQALLELTTWAERGYDLALTPDGPRGPRYIVQDGLMSLAQLTGLPILPFSYNLDWKISVKSWDRFQIPLPFSRCEMNLGKPIYLPREATEAEREAVRQQVEAAMRAISRD